FHAAATSVPLTVSLHDALPICSCDGAAEGFAQGGDERLDGDHGVDRVEHAGHGGDDAGGEHDDTDGDGEEAARAAEPEHERLVEDRKSTRLNSSHVKNSYAVFC